MTAFEWVSTRWPRSAAGGEHAASILRIEPGAAHVPREYRALYTYLERRYASVVVLTFEQIEALVGSALPAVARTEREWWTTVVDTRHHSAAWSGAGRTAEPNLAAGIVTFERPV